jgi:hypothetical protein
MSQPRNDPSLSAVERALAGLAPSAGALNRDALMFAAGRASAPRGWGWPCAAGATLAAAALAVLLFFRPAPEPVVRYVPAPAAPQETAPSPPPAGDSLAQDEAPVSPPRPGMGYLTLRQQVERWGDAGLPSTPLADDGKPTESPDAGSGSWLRRRQAVLNTGDFQ